MKRRLLLAALVFCAGAGLLLLFVDTTPQVPLAVVITGVTKQEDGGMNFYFTVSNRTSQPRLFFTYPQRLSNGVWSTSVADHAPFGGVKGVKAHATYEQIVYTYRNSGELRLQITYWTWKTPRQKQLDDWLKKLGLPPRYDDRVRREITTPPTNFLSR